MHTEYHHAACGLLSTTLDGVIVEVNDTFLGWTGWGRDDLVGRRTFAELLSPGGRIYHETHFSPLLRVEGKVQEMALELVTTAHARIPVLVNAVLDESADDGADGAPVVQLAVFGVAQRREYERELRRERDRAEQSEIRARALAQTLQQTLIPPSPPLVPGLEVAAVYRPAGTGEEVGGDLYDVFQVADDDWVVVLGDVCGKGVEAAVITALVRYTIRASSVLAADPASVLADLDRVLLAPRLRPVLHGGAAPAGPSRGRLDGPDGGRRPPAPAAQVRRRATGRDRRAGSAGGRVRRHRAGLDRAGARARRSAAALH